MQPQQLRADREGLGPFVRQRAFQAYSAQSEPEDSVLHTSIRDAIDHYLAERPPLRDVICNNATALCRAYSTTPDCSEAFADHLDYLTIKYMMDVISSQSDHGLRRISRVGPAIELAVSPMIIVSAHYGPYLPLVGLIAEQHPTVFVRSRRPRDSIIESFVQRLGEVYGVHFTNSLDDASIHLANGRTLVVLPDTTHFFDSSRNVVVPVGRQTFTFLRGFAELLARVRMAPLFAAYYWQGQSIKLVVESGAASANIADHAEQYGAFLAQRLRYCASQWDRLKYCDLMLQT